MRSRVLLSPAVYIVLALFAVFVVFPFANLVIVSLQETFSLFAIRLGFVSRPTLNNYVRLVGETAYARWMLNTLIVAISVTGYKLLSDALAGYVFAKRDFPGANFIFITLLGTQMIPWCVTMIPSFMIVQRLGLVNKYWSLILPQLASPIGIFLMRQFIQTLPSELEDAARLDGCSDLAIFWRIVFPLCKPPLAVLAIITFMTQWNNFVWPLIVTTSDEKRTLTVGLASFPGQFITDWGLVMAGAILSVIPVLILFVFFQQYFVEGLTAGAFK